MPDLTEMTAAEFNAMVTRRMSEATFQERVRQLAIACGWRFFHTHNSRHSPAGFPDVVAVRGERVIFAELKRQGGKLSPAQQEWLGDLAGADTVEAYIWYPSDRDEVLEILR